MIIVFALDDKYVIENAYHNDKGTFGVSYFYHKSLNYPKAGRNEDVFITAHGNDFEIGNFGDDIVYNPASLAKHVYEHFLPANFQGNFYIFSCNSAPKFNANFKKEMLKLHSLYKGEVFGCDKKVSYPIYHPSNNGWKKA